MDTWQEFPRWFFGTPRRALTTITLAFIALCLLIRPLGRLVWYSVVVPVLVVWFLYILIRHFIFPRSAKKKS
jgi:uncharacterized membrane protein YjdF